MTLQQLEYIVALDNHRHFVKASQACFVTQPTLTMQVQKLEEELGITLFDRRKKPLQPTPAGEQIVLESREILNRVKNLKAFITGEKDTMEGEFRVGIIPTLAPYLLPEFLPGFVEKNPTASLHIQELQTNEIIDALKKDKIDIGILVTPLNERHIREIPLFNEPFLLYLPEENTLSGRDRINSSELDVTELLVLSEGHCFRNQTIKICSQEDRGCNVGFDYESGSIEALKRMVKKGVGYTLVPELSVLNELNSNYVKRFVNPQPVREVSLAVSYGFTREILIDKLRSSILDAIPDRFESNSNHYRVKWR